MGDILAKAIEVYRDFTTDGVQSSGLHDPEKVDIRALFRTVDIAVYAAQAGLTVVGTTAARDAWFEDNPNTLVYVNNNNGEPDDPANGVYEYVDGAPRLAEGFYQGVASVVAPLVTQAEDAADVATEAARALTMFRNIDYVAANPEMDRLRLRLVAEDGVWPEDLKVGLKWFTRDDFGASPAASDRLLLEIVDLSDGSLLVSVPGGFDPNTDPLAQGGTGKVTMPATLSAEMLALGFVSGEFEIDYRDGGNFGGAALDPDDAEIFVARVMFNDGDAVEELVARGLAADAPLNNGVWASAVRSPVLRGMFPDFWLYGADKSHDYGMVRLSFFAGAGNVNPYVRIHVDDLTTASQVVSGFIQIPAPASSEGTAKAEFVAWLTANRSRIALTDELSAFSNLSGFARMDWTPLLTLAYGDHDFPTYAEGGLSRSRVFGLGDIADYLQSDHYHELIEVGPGKAHATLRGAIESLLRPATAETGMPVSEQAHYHHRIRVRMTEGVFNATHLDIPPYVELEGAGPGRTIVRRENADPDAMLEGHFETKAFDLTLESLTDPEYPWHSDPSNKRCFTPAGVQNRCIQQKFERVEFVLIGDNVGQGFGCGIPSGGVIEKYFCSARHMTSDLPGALSVAAAFFYHSTGPTVTTPEIDASILPARIRHVGCHSADDYLDSVFLQSIHAAAQVTFEQVGCQYAMIRHQVAGGGEVVTDLARDRVQFAFMGTYGGAMRFDDAEGAPVLSVPPGTTVAGPLAALIFGEVDELGRGEKWIRNGTSKSVGARLGNRTGNTDELTLDGVDWVPTTNLTAASNATIYAAIEAATGVEITEVDIARERYPDTGFTRRVNNASGVTIPKGRFVKRTARGQIALAQPGDRIFGWTFRAILNGDDGDVVTTRRVWFEYLQGAVEDGGRLMLVGDGKISHGAAVTGSVAGNVLSVTAVTSGTLAIGMSVSGQDGAGDAIPAGATISALGTGAGGVGTYILSAAAPQPVDSTTVTATVPVSLAVGDCIGGILELW